MSLDVYLTGKPKRVKCVCRNCWNEHYAKSEEEYYWANITHNLTQMADKAGVYYALWRPEEKGWRFARDIILVLEIGLGNLKGDPIFYKQFNPPNEWGSYDGLVEFIERYLEACKEHPKARIRVSR